MRTIDRIFIHHSLTKDGTSKSWNAIREYHTGTLGWADIGYHFGIEQHDNDLAVFTGRSLALPGAHAKGHNKNSIGICLVGNYDLAPPPAAAMEMLHVLVVGLMRRYGIPASRVYPHFAVARKTCPGSQFPWADFIKGLV